MSKLFLPLGTYASIAIDRTVIDNSRLEFSLIGRMECTENGKREDIDPDFLLGLESSYGYTRDNCQVAKTEILARDLVNCTFGPSSAAGRFERCTPIQSATYYRSFMDVNQTATADLPVKTMTDAVRERYSKVCPQDCRQDRYTVTSSYGDMSPSLKLEITEKLNKLPGTPNVNSNVVVLRFFLNSMEYQMIQNFPQHGLQFLAEVGGLMAFFLGISAISVFECLCYSCCFIRNTCCGCCDRDDDDGRSIANEELPPPRWKEAQNPKYNGGGAERRRSNPGDRYDERRY